jgi:hypothetical protein
MPPNHLTSPQILPTAVVDDCEDTEGDAGAMSGFELAGSGFEFLVSRIVSTAGLSGVVVGETVVVVLVDL